MIVAIVGCGNVGANLLQYIVNLSGVDKIWAVDVTDDHVEAAIMDVAGVEPQGARKICGTTSNLCLNEADIVLLTAGGKIGPKETPQDAARKNFAIVTQTLENIQLKKSEGNQNFLLSQVLV